MLSAGRSGGGVVNGRAEVIWKLDDAEIQGILIRLRYVNEDITRSEKAG